MAKQTSHQTRSGPRESRRQSTASGEEIHCHRNAGHNYFLLEKFEAGVVLTGTEVKAIRTVKPISKTPTGSLKTMSCGCLNLPYRVPTNTKLSNHAACVLANFWFTQEEIRS